MKIEISAKIRINELQVKLYNYINCLPFSWLGNRVVGTDKCRVLIDYILLHNYMKGGTVEQIIVLVVPSSLLRHALNPCCRFITF